MGFITTTTKINNTQNIIYSDTPPVSPTIGQTWSDTSQNPPVLKKWNGTEWVVVELNIKQLDPITIEEINKTIDDAIQEAQGDQEKIQEAIDKANEAIQQAGFNNTQITEIKQQQSEDGQKITQIQTNYNGLQETVKDLDTKTESYHTQLSGQISDVVKDQSNINQQIQTANKNISSLQTSTGELNQKIDTANESIQQISKKTDDNSQLINTVKSTADSNKQSIVDTNGRVSTVEQTLTEQKQTIADNTGKINQAIQDIDSAERTISSIDGRVTKTEQSLDGVSSTVSKVQSDLNTTNSKLDNKADTSYVNNKVDGISIGGTNILKNTEKMDNSTGNYWVSEGNVTLQDGVATVKQAWASREYLLDDLNKYIENNDVKNKKYILSVDIMRTTQDIISNTQIRFYLEQSGSHATILVDDLSKLPINKWVRKSVPIILLGQNETSLTRGRFRIECTTNNEWKFRRMKLEEGTKATDWSPSPEDNASQSDLNDTNEKIDNISVGGTNLLQNSDPMPILVSYPATQDSTMDADWQKFTTNISGKEVLPKDNAKYMLQLQANMDIVQSIMVQTDGQVNSAQFTFYDTAHHIVDAKIKLISDGNGVKTYQLWCNYKTNGNKFRCIDLKTINYTGNYIKFKHSMIEQGNIPTSWSPDPRDTQTQINQTADKVEIIASENGNPNSYFNISSDGTITIGANKKLLLNANTKVGDNFLLSANNISAGSIKGKNMEISLDTGNIKTSGPASTSYYQGGALVFEDNTSHNQAKLIADPSRFSLSGSSSDYGMFLDHKSRGVQLFSPGTMLEIGSGRLLYRPDVSLPNGLEIVKSVARDNLYNGNNTRVTIGVDLNDRTKSALATPTLYVNEIDSSSDGQTKGITISDKLLIDEGIWSNWNKSGKQTGIKFPSENSGDSIEFHTAEGDNGGAYFKIANGNWNIKTSTGRTIENQKHSIIPGGNGYTITFSNTETDNAQGDASASVIAKEFLTASSKSLKDEIEPINNIDKAVEDILKIEPKQYYYKTQLKKIKEWEEKGKPENEYKNLDTEINIGFVAEDFEDFDSLRPFVTKITNEYGDEGILGIDYSKFVPLLVAVCQRQEKEIKELENRTTKLELLVDKLLKGDK